MAHLELVLAVEVKYLTGPYIELHKIHFYFILVKGMSYKKNGKDRNLGLRWCRDVGHDQDPAHDGMKCTVVGVGPRRQFWQFKHARGRNRARIKETCPSSFTTVMGHRVVGCSGILPPN
jgi:hypothetical protein